MPQTVCCALDATDHPLYPFSSRFNRADLFHSSQACGKAGTGGPGSLLSPGTHGRQTLRGVELGLEAAPNPCPSPSCCPHRGGDGLRWGQQTWGQAGFLPLGPVGPTPSWNLCLPQTALGPHWASLCLRQLWGNVGQGLRPVRVWDLRVGVFMSMHGSGRADPALEREIQI